MIYIFLFALGAIIGSFLNVVGLRYRSGLGIGGRSFCFVCRTELKWYELVPVVSFAAQRGKCRTCKAPVSWQYPLVEMITGLVFASLYGVFGLSLSYLLALGVFSLYIIIAIYDARHTVVPDELAYAAAVLAFAVAVFEGRLFASIAAAVALYLFFWILWRVSGGRAVGLGDAKLGLSVGLIAGLPAGLSALAMGFWVGTIVVLGVMIFGGKKLTMKSEIAFAPFLAAGALLALILHADLFHLS